MKHFEQRASVIAPTRPGQGSASLAILQDRKAGLEEMIRSRFRACRNSGTPADVSSLSAALRKVKNDMSHLERGGAS